MNGTLRSHAASATASGAPAWATCTWNSAGLGRRRSSHASPGITGVTRTSNARRRRTRRSPSRVGPHGPVPSPRRHVDRRSELVGQRIGQLLDDTFHAARGPGGYREVTWATAGARGAGGSRRSPVGHRSMRLVQ